MSRHRLQVREVALIGFWLTVIAALAMMGLLAGP